MGKIESLDQIPSCDHIHIGFDYAKGKDAAALTVMRKSGRGMEVISTFCGEEALWLYARLINGPNTRGTKFMRSDMFQSPLYMTMPKGLGLSEAKENFRQYLNDMYDVPNSDDFASFKRSFKDCEIVMLNPDKDGTVEVRFNFGEDQNFLHLAYRITERELVNIAPAKMEQDLCRRAIYDLERSMKK